MDQERGSLKFLLGCIIGSLALVYAVPSALQSLALPVAGPWISAVFAGGLVGCGILAVLRGWRTGAGLYLLVTLVKSVCLAAGWIEPQQLIWFNNLIPSLFVGFIVHQRLAAQMLEEPETL